MSAREKITKKRTRTTSVPPSSLGKAISQKPPPPDDPQPSTSNVSSVRIARANAIATVSKRDSNVKARINDTASTPSTANITSTTPRTTRSTGRLTSLNPPTRPPPTPRVASGNANGVTKEKIMDINSSNVKKAPAVARNKGAALPKSAWALNQPR